MPSGAPRPIRDLARRAVQAELVDVAQRLFEEHGYESTTVEMIAGTAGMSRRSFFRYFGSKEELVLGKYELLGQLLLEELRGRPNDEPLWTALRAVFDAMTEREVSGPRIHPIERIVDETPPLRAGYLYRLDAIQRTLSAEARERARRAGEPFDDADPAPEAVVGAAFACMIAARASAATSTHAWRDLVGRSMAAVREIGRLEP